MINQQVPILATMGRVKHALSAIALSVFLASCAGTNVSGTWDCPAQQGEACTTIEEADKKYGGGKNAPTNSSPAPFSPSAGTVEESGRTLPLPDSSHFRNASLYQIRSAEQTARVWIYPFVDAADSYHEGAYVHMVIRPAGWITNPRHIAPAQTACPALSPEECKAPKIDKEASVSFPPPPPPEPATGAPVRLLPPTPKTTLENILGPAPTPPQATAPKASEDDSDPYLDQFGEEDK